MPWVAVLDGDIVHPHEAKGEQPLLCKECEESVHLVRSHRRGSTTVPPFFRHDPGSSCGGGGETLEHQRMKAIVAQKLPTLEFTFERIKIDCEWVGEKRPDVLAVFETPCYPWGRGLAIECQHTNVSKDKNAAQQEYLDHEFSTVWLDGDDFDNWDVDFPTNPKDSRVLPVFPRGVPSHPSDAGPLATLPVGEQEVPVALDPFIHESRKLRPEPAPMYHIVNRLDSDWGKRAIEMACPNCGAATEAEKLDHHRYRVAVHPGACGVSGNIWSENYGVIRA